MKILQVVVVILVLTGAALIVSQVWTTPPSPRPSNRVIVGATIFPLADIARHVGGDQVEVLQIIPPNISEHSTTLSPEQLRQLQTAQVIFQVGHNLDTTLTEKITRSLPDIPVVTVDRTIAIREFGASENEEHVEAEEAHHHDTGTDPHYWLTVPNAQKIAVTIADELRLIDPAHESDYQANLTAYLEKLDTLERELKQQAAQAPQKKMITMHNAWSYFADQYGFELIATYEPIEGRDPSLGDLDHLRKLITEHGIHVFYSEPQKHSTSATRFLHDEFKLEIRILDPVGGLPPYDSYENLMRTNMRALAS